MTQKEASSHHPCVSSALTCCVCRHNPFTPACLTLYCVVHLRCTARTRSSNATCTNSSRCSVLRATSCEPSVRPPASRTSPMGETLTLSDYHRRELITVVSYWAHN